MTSTPLRVAVTAATTTVVVLVVRACFDHSNQLLFYRQFVYRQFGSSLGFVPADFLVGTVVPAVVVVPTVTVAAVVVYLAWRRR